VATDELGLGIAISIRDAPGQLLVRPLRPHAFLDSK
jgi:hypothetical protein